MAEYGDRTGKLAEVVSERDLDTDQPKVELAAKEGRIGPDLTIGADATSAVELMANEGLSWNGMMLAASGFRLTPEAAHRLRRAEPSSSPRI